ncbi:MULTISPECIES: L7Ae/L30e/S12e/Gadd45 family ribosomal protein [Virgibacillus]|uniref:Putative ribosomal protein YlxQ n=1 Tax=Virgibacillus dokdonensis TaxID=302167 RepID=A0A2K9J3V2_9BACI|nr:MULTISPECIES: ribosomal L7Ae/L30e/S12e/Gadd45 family protein [Virgibacillus]AUJ26642.1 putative ribosomal protein YlxQ [Virgibacillus dokdonensis]NWO13009.1 ribosomal L7Ae/L30e/S12e/Gadd45 family protein [Virgibacillus sp.]
MKNNYLNLLGLAFRAGKCSLGEDAILKDIRSRRAVLVLLANDIGPQTKKKITDKCKTYKIPYVIVDDRETISNAIGKTQRVAIAILDAGFAAKMNTLLGE